MHIKSIILDGFKSYGKRTEIKGFDPEFNAITGLNGTGKSNVLDSICFVLGISNLSQVRATSLQDLVYKSGQAGVRQASVTIIFDNSNKAQSPIGFEGKDEICITRQVMIGGKNKYLLNGRVVLNNRIQDLFASVKLNINNPNFLIMQGRVTKVLNMKSLEILSMIEEAVGSKMFDQKMLKSTQIFQKKSEKLVEFQTQLNETIKPRLAKLEKDKILFLEFQRMSKEIDYLTRLHFSHKYMQLRKSSGQYEQRITSIQCDIETHRTAIAEAEKTIENYLKEIAAVEDTISGSSKSELLALEKDLKECETTEAKTVAERSIIKNTIKTETKNLHAIEKTLGEDKATHNKRLNGMRSEEEVYNQFQALIEEGTKAFEVAQKNFEAVSCGLEVNDEGQASSLLEQLMKAKETASEENTTIKQCEMQLKNLRGQLQSKKNAKNKQDSTYTRERANLDRIEKEVNALKATLDNIDYEEGSLERLEQSRAVLRHEVQSLQQNLDNQNSYRYDFKYRTPEPNFDHSRVKGRVCKLFKVKDPKFCVALETCAGGSLYSVVTDNDITSKLILQKGDLQSRTTMIPLNKIKGYTIDPKVVKLAKEVGGQDKVYPALSLIDYDPQLEPVMRFIFGGTFVCTDMNVAKRVTYHKGVMQRSVTLDGDTLDPEGSLSGGAANKGGSILQHLAEILKIETSFKSKQHELMTVDSQISNLKAIATKYNSTKEQLDVLGHKQKTVQLALGNTTFEQYQVELIGLEHEIEVLQEQLTKSTQEKEAATKKAKELEAKIAESKQGRDQQLKRAEGEVQKTKKKLEEDKKRWKNKKAEFDIIKAEMTDLEEAIAKAEADRVALVKTIAEQEEKLKDLEEGRSGNVDRVSELKDQIQRKRDELKQRNKELNGIHKKKDEQADRIGELNLTIKKNEMDIVQIQNENSESETQIKTMERTYVWIVEDREHFGKANTQYDYSKHDPNKALHKLNALLNDQKRIALNLNQNVLHLLKQEEEQHAKVLKHIDEIEADKASIQEFLEKNEREKLIQVEKACVEVNRNFSEIFSTILPGVQAMLKTVDGDFRKGLDIKVGFNGVWKESLSELSGGQRSLVALSLILAMLKYNPAPIYILDEVDAALDLSHTQNIGKMLKIHFKDSQFIIVSLKDGMFNNANVLFRTQLTEGISGITRTTNRNF